MQIYEIRTMKELLSANTYPGRGIVVGKTADGKHAAAAYFIMGRSANSRNRVFAEYADGEVRTLPFDPTKVEDPSLIIYPAILKCRDSLIVTNGDQTQTVYDFLMKGDRFEDALETRTFEPDAPNLTPRISAILRFVDGDFTYRMSILKSADGSGSACNRYLYSYQALNGLGHFLHTYLCDGNPIPTFCGEPERVAIPDSIDAFTDEIWNNLNEQNKISLYVRYVNLNDGSVQNRMVNKNR